MVGPRGWQRARPNIQKSMEDDDPDGRAADADEGELSMRAITKIVLAGTLIGAAVADGKGTANAQYYYPPTPYGYGGGGQTWNGCPPGYTVQGGNCAPYRGSGGGGWNTWNVHRTERQLRTLSRSNRLPAAPMVWLLNSSGRRLSAYLIGRRLADPSAMRGFCRENFPLRM